MLVDGAAGIATPELAQERLERAINRARFVGAALLIALGPRVANVGLGWIVALAAFVVIYGLVLRRASQGTMSADARSRIARVAIAGDAAIVAAGMFIFSPDARWTAFVVGVLVVITGAFRFGAAGALQTAGALSLAYVGIEMYRERAFGFPLVVEQAASHVAMYFLTALLMAGIVRELREARAGEAANRAELERHVRELDEANLRLAEQTRRAEAANEAKSRFLSGASHELRTPLNAVLGFAGLLGEQLSGLLDERQSRYLRNIEDAGNRLLALVDDVLAYAHLEAGRADAGEHADVGLGALTAPALEHARSIAGSRGVTVKANVTEDARARVDPEVAHRILVSLLGSAVRATPAGGTVVLDVSSGHDGVTFEVADEGPAIRPDQRDHVFQPFATSRGDGGDTEPGVGLAVAERLVRLHGGVIEVESGAGDGATFRVRLPERSTA